MNRMPDARYQLPGTTNRAADVRARWNVLIEMVVGPSNYGSTNVKHRDATPRATILHNQQCVVKILMEVPALRMSLQ